MLKEIIQGSNFSGIVSRITEEKHKHATAKALQEAKLQLDIILDTVSV